MQISRRKTLGALGIATVAAALPASVARAAPPPQIIELNYTPFGEVGVRARVECLAPVVSVTARLFNQTRTVEVGRYDLALSVGFPTSGTWIGAPLNGMPLGNYFVEITATSAEGLVTTGGREYFIWLQSIFTATVDPATMDIDRRMVTLQGTAVGKHPVTQELIPLGAMPITLGVNYRPDDLEDPPSQFATTQADGSFSWTTTLAGPAQLGAATYRDPWETYIMHGGVVLEVTGVRRQARITAEIDATTLDVGESATLRGLVEFDANGQWQPVSGHAVDVYFKPDPDIMPESYVDRASTDAHGRYEIIVTPEVHGYYKVLFNNNERAFFYTSASAQSPTVTVLQRVRFEENYFIVRPMPGHARNWEMIGIIWTHVRPARIEVQFRPDSAAAWQTLNSSLSVLDPTDNSQVFIASFIPPRSGQVRAYAPPSSLTQAGASQVATINLPPQLVTRRPQERNGDPQPQPLPPQPRRLDPQSHPLLPQPRSE